MITITLWFPDKSGDRENDIAVEKEFEDWPAFYAWWDLDDDAQKYVDYGQR